MFVSAPEYKDLLEREFLISYHGKLGSISDIQAMPVFEADWHYRRLVEVRKEEKRQSERDAATMRGSVPSPPPPTRSNRMRR